MSQQHNTLALFFSTKLGCEAVYNREIDQINFNIDIQGHDLPCFVDFKDEGRLIQMICFLPFEAESDKLGEMARLLNYLNSRIDYPGFALDEKENLIFFRMVIPYLKKELEESELAYAFDVFKLNVLTGLKTLEGLDASAS